MSEVPHRVIPPQPPRRSGETIDEMEGPAIEKGSSLDGTPHLKHLVEDVSIGDDAVQFFIGGRNDEMETRHLEVGQGSWSVQVNNMESGEDINKLAEIVERDRKRATSASRTANVRTPAESTPSSFVGSGCTLGSQT